MTKQFKTLPYRPTKEMIAAGRGAYPFGWRAVWYSIFDAAPSSTPPVEGEVVQELRQILADTKYEPGDHTVVPLKYDELRRRVEALATRTDPPKDRQGRRVGGEPANEADHFIICADCDQAIDCRDLDEVFRHEEPGHLARSPT